MNISARADYKTSAARQDGRIIHKILRRRGYNPGMTSKDMQAELLKDPFVPFRIHRVSGKFVDVSAPGIAWLMQNSILVFQHAKPSQATAGGYDVIALRNIERIEQRQNVRRKAS
jgi:hypothetical protein